MAMPQSAWCTPMPVPLVPTVAEPFAVLRNSAQPHPVPRLPVARVEVPLQSNP